MTAVLIAITIVLSIPLNLGPLVSLGFISFPPAIAVTIVHVPTIIAAILEGPIVGAIVGAAFGLFSLFLATQPTAGPGNAPFVDPLVSVLPRLFIGPMAWLLYRSLRGAGEQVRLGSAAIAGTLTNTILVIGAIAWRFGLPFFGILASVGVNVVLEVVVAVVIVVAVINALRGTAYGRGVSSV
jgi:uncharacterized membrane protein